MSQVTISYKQPLLETPFHEKTKEKSAKPTDEKTKDKPSEKIKSENKETKKK